MKKLATLSILTGMLMIPAAAGATTYIIEERGAYRVEEAEFERDDDGEIEYEAEVRSVGGDYEVEYERDDDGEVEYEIDD